MMNRSLFSISVLLILSASSLVACAPANQLSGQDPVTAAFVFDGEYSLESSTCPTPSPVLVVRDGAASGRADLDFAGDLAKPYEQRSFLFEGNILSLNEPGNCASSYKRASR